MIIAYTSFNLLEEIDSYFNVDKSLENTANHPPVYDK